MNTQQQPQQQPPAPLTKEQAVQVISEMNINKAFDIISSIIDQNIKSGMFPGRAEILVIDAALEKLKPV